MDKNMISVNIIKYRKANGLTQKQLAEKLNYSDKVISKWERNESLPDIIALSKLAECFNISVDELIGQSVQHEKEQTDKVTLIHHKKPSEWLIYSIIPFIIVWLYQIVHGPMVFALASIIFAMLLFIYAILISHHGWRAVYLDHEILIINKPSHASLYIDGILVDRHHSFMSAGLSLQGECEDKIIKIYLSYIFKAKCELTVL
jgi:transcriptional regulator with XRE-family HTH domain